MADPKILDVVTYGWIKRHDPRRIINDVSTIKAIRKEAPSRENGPFEAAAWEALGEICEDINDTLQRIEDTGLRARVAATVQLALWSSHAIGLSSKSGHSPENILSQFARNAGRASGKRRAAKAAETWEPVALKLALASRKENKGWSQDDVAHYVLQHWGKEKNKPSHRTLKARISAWIKTGKLPDKFRQ